MHGSAGHRGTRVGGLGRFLRDGKNGIMDWNNRRMNGSRGGRGARVGGGDDVVEDGGDIGLWMRVTGGWDGARVCSGIAGVVGCGDIGGLGDLIEKGLVGFRGLEAKIFDDIGADGVEEVG